MRLNRILFAALAALATMTAADAAEQVDIAESDTTLHGIVFRPEGPGPFPGVVALHGCESLINRSQDGCISPTGAVVAAGWSFRQLRIARAADSRRVFGAKPEHERVATPMHAAAASQPWTIKNRVSSARLGERRRNVGGQPRHATTGAGLSFRGCLYPGRRLSDRLE